MTVPFISVADLGNYMAQDLSSSDLAVMSIDAACDVIRDEIDQVINLVVDDIVVLDGRQRDMLIPGQVPIVAVTEITIDGGTPLIEGTDFRVVNERTMIQRLSSGAPDDDVVWSRETAISITYTHGWAVTEDAVDTPSGIFRVPSSIRMMALSLAAGGMVAGTVGVGGVKSEKIGTYSYTLADNQTGSSGMMLTESQCDTLYKYRVEGVA